MITCCSSATGAEGSWFEQKKQSSGYPFQELMFWPRQTGEHQQESIYQKMSKSVISRPVTHVKLSSWVHVAGRNQASPVDERLNRKAQTPRRCNEVDENTRSGRVRSAPSVCSCNAGNIREKDCRAGAVYGVPGFITFSRRNGFCRNGLSF